MLALDAVDPYLGTLAKDVLLIESGVTSHLHMHFPSGEGTGLPEDAYAQELRDTLRAHREAGQRVALAPHWRDRSRLAYDGDDGFIAALPHDLRARARRLAGSAMPNEAYIATIRELVRRAARRAAAERPVRDHGAAVGERRARRGGRRGRRRARRGRPPARAREPAAARLGRRLRRRARARAPRGRRRARRAQRARARRLAARLRHRAPRAHRRYGRAQLLLEPAARRRDRAAPGARRGGRLASRSASTTWASPTTTTCSPRCAWRTPCNASTASPSIARLRPAEVFGLMWDGGARVIGAGAGRRSAGSSRVCAATSS